MFWRKKKEPETDLSWLHTDMHSHLVPGIDDGAPDLATAVELVRGLAGLGYKKLITTPHVLWDLYQNTPEKIAAGIEDLRKGVQEAGIEVELAAAAEYFIDDHFEQQLKAKAPLLHLSGNLVLVEFSMLTAPLELQQVLFDLQLEGHQPLIAHPERYTYLSRKRSFFDELRDAGCQFQLNLLSLTGYYGNSVQELAEYLLKNDFYAYAGTDLHNPRHLEMLRRLGASPLFRRLQEERRMKNREL
ncbi:MAG TPA: CpsB/CapC family capsule biosynthesis tyrosine phosphatase [Chitinophagaceae bacterium]|jgi:tyrosine-protein phosphatase YwqE|nr:CpsB/CapC family capsule biosynthesis tyrosine phosphatase [Chitinophagaceae bacterium]